MKRYDIDKIKSIPILDVAAKLDMPIKKKGIRYFTQCLWHEDSNPSMVLGGLYPNLCHCYACGETHDVIGLIMAHENMDFKEACEWASNKFNIAPAPPNSIVSSPPSVPPFSGDRNPERGGNNNGKLSYLKRQERLLAKAPSLRGNRRSTAVRESQLAGGETLCFKSDILHQMNMMESSFARCLKHTFGATRAVEVVRMYQLGAMQAKGRYPDVMFPNIDIHGNIHDIKIQAYECDERSDRYFHRLNTCYWLKSVLLRKEDLDKESIFKNIPPSGGLGGLSGMCLFGEHLLALHPAMTVALVESPKNACVGAAAHPEFIWVAVGNKSALNREVLSVLQGRRVVVFPDSDACDEWKAKLDTMQDIATFVCQHIEGANGKEDIADHILGLQAPLRVV